MMKARSGLICLILALTFSASASANLFSLFEDAAEVGAGAALKTASRVTGQVGRRVLPLVRRPLGRGVGGIAWTMAETGAAAAIGYRIAAGGGRLTLEETPTGLVYYRGVLGRPQPLKGASWPADLIQAIRAEGDINELVVDRKILLARAGELAPILRETPIMLEVGTETALPVRIESIQNVPQAFVSISRRLMLPIRELDSLSDIDWLLRQPLRREDLRVVSLFAPDEIDALDRLRAVAGDRLLEVPRGAATQAFKNTVREFVQGKIAIFIGHVEHGAYVTRDAESRITGSLKLSDASEIARHDQGMPLLIGCSTYSTCLPSGLPFSTVDTEAAAGIGRIFTANSYGELLSSLGTPSNPLVISAALINDEVNLLQFRLRQLETLRDIGRPLSLFARIDAQVITRPEVLDELEPEAIIWYIPTLMCSLILWPGFVRHYSVLPNARQQPVLFLAAWLLRGSLFVVFSGVVSFFLLCVMLMGAWKEAGKTISVLWKLVLEPINTVFAIFSAIRLPKSDRAKLFWTRLLVMALPSAIALSLAVKYVLPLFIAPVIYLHNDPDVNQYAMVMQLAAIFVAYTSGVFAGWTILQMAWFGLATKLKLI